MSVDARHEPTLPGPPPQFFMNLADLRFWAQSFRADQRLAALRAAHGDEQAFDQLYADGADPWGALGPRFRYQRLKYRRLVGLLPARRYHSVLDLGCGLGEVCRLLAPHAEAVLGLDFSASAVAQARSLSADQPHLSFEVGDVLHLALPCERQFDLVVVADVLYYLSPLTPDVLAGVRDAVAGLLAPGGILALANHCLLGFDRDSKTTRSIHDVFAASPAWQQVRERWRPFFLTTVFQRAE